MAYRRCECTISDIPHPVEIAHKRPHSRCTRVVTFEIRRVRDTNGRKCEGPWYAYCDQCGRAIRAYQTTDVEMRPAPETLHRGKHLASCLFEGGRWFCAADCQFHTIVDMDAEPRKKAVSR